mmetsp:Transcript_17899/g.27996  ORF Transcript_17899/g.27996 Transcript_17899/m.27996 type:complete len:285 (-) Transcript_17899:45-899(-)
MEGGRGNLDEESREKLVMVYSWLSSVYKNRQPPEWEMNPYTINILYEIANKNREKDEDISILKKDYELKTQEYEADGKRIQQTLEEMTIPLENFSHSGQETVRSTAKMCVILNTKDTRLNSLKMGVANLVADKTAVEDEVEEEGERLERGTKEMKSRLVLLSKLSSILSQCEEGSKVEGEGLALLQTISYLNNKKKEYEESINSLSAEIERSGYRPQLSHTALVEMKEEEAKLRKEMEPREKEVKGYRELPPDVSLATLKVEETRRLLASLEKEIQAKLETMHL